MSINEALTARPQPDTLPAQTMGAHRVQTTRLSIRSQSYLGEVSDVRFFNLVKQIVQDGPSDQLEEDVDSYEQEELIPSNALGEVSLELPEPQAADLYLDVYFSTIHIAYPFIPKSSFIRTYNQVREGAENEGVDSPWLALLYVIFAIGAYYTSFPDKRTPASLLHQEYFQRALSLVKSGVAERSLNHVSFLLAQCFYFLATCRTDRCWTTLGLAVRIGQSIGLHVESSDTKFTSGRSMLRAETRRRVWYSMYVLDRLLALQLGRPPAIHEDDCHIQLPSRINDAGFDWEGDAFPLDADRGPSAGDYFLCVIEFSNIVGYVLRGLYSPSQRRIAAESLLSTQHLDERLLEWKTNLPRHLRFDLGHTFEKSVTSKRQRNMLAIKFHHLRALIHRPYLCLPLLRHQNGTSIALSETQYQRLDQYGSICMAEAQETAHLLHNVVDERELVQDFPWWQMISCLICASSILLVASAFPGKSRTSEKPDGATLTEDAETCMKVFEALSVNSDGARIAKDMMERLKDHCVKLSNLHEGHTQPHVEVVGALQTSRSLAMAIPSYHGNPVSMPDPPFGGVWSSSQIWPSEISDSMMWSAQFFDAAEGISSPVCYSNY